MNVIDFEKSFTELMGFHSFGWQRRLFNKFVDGDFESCSTCRLPTGLGKTSLLTLWLIAVASNPKVVPRRLVYVVNRRTVVDQTTFEAEKLRTRLARVPEIERSLRELCSVVVDDDETLCPLAISTLRGQFADNRQWMSDPCRPAIISGTVDMIGSRLLFSGYRCGFKSKPLHAGFLGTDTLLIHDEAHLEPAFQSLCEKIQQEQVAGRFPEFEASRRFKVIELSATTRNTAQHFEGTTSTKIPFELLPDEFSEPTVKKRVEARKGIVFHEVENENEIAERLLALAQTYRDSGCAILVFVQRVSDLKKVVEGLSKGREKKSQKNISQLAGPIRGYERERLATEDPVFQRFLPESSRNDNVKPTEGTVYLVSTSAGEVGVNISADHMVSDLTTFESVAQRLGRVNRFGDGDAQVEMVASDSIVRAKDDSLKPFELATKRTWMLLKSLHLRDDGRHDASSLTLSKLPTELVADAFSPCPEILPVDDCLFDAWSWTTLSIPSVTSDVPGRPSIENWLHGISENDPPQTQVAWRREVSFLSDSVIDNQTRAFQLEHLLDAYPLKPHELLQDQTNRVFDALKAIVVGRDKDEKARDDDEDLIVWVVDRKGTVAKENLRRIANPEAKANQRKQLESELANKTVVLPATLGGLDQNGMLVGKFDENILHDVADEWFNGSGGALRMRYRRDNQHAEDPKLQNSMREVLRIRLPSSTDADDETNDEVWCVRRRELDDDSLSFANQDRQLLGPHLASAEFYARQFTKKLDLDAREVDAVVSAARFHDLGKRRRLWQCGIGNPDYQDNHLDTAWAKSGTFRPPVNRHYRHEFGSLADVREQPAFIGLNEESQDLALHLIAAHHGRARPHFPRDEAFDPERDECSSDAIARDCVVRFGRLQRRYGRWQLAWLESLVRAADYLASQQLVPEANFELANADEVTA